MTISFCRKIRELVRSRQVWIGLSDRVTEGVWQFSTNNETFNTYDAGNVFKWSAGNPNNSNDQDCVWVGYKEDGLMDDLQCEHSFYGLCEIVSRS